MSIEFRDAKRADVALLVLLAGGTGSGKTESALRLATGLANGKPFCVIDTERGRALHKADDYTFKHASLEEPFTPERYAEAVKAADDEGFPVIVIDSGSHEWEGVGGVLDMQTAEFERLGGQERARMSSWIEPKKRHKKFVQQLLRARAHVILCLRAEDKIEIIKQDGKTVVRPKQTLTGADGWVPIVEKRLPFEATISLLLTADCPGHPKPIKLERRHQDLVLLDEPLNEETGKRLAEWARGGASAKSGMSKADFSAKVAAAGLSQDRVRELGKSLFPAKASLSALNNAERTELWAALETDSDPGAGGSGSGDEAEETEASVQPQADTRTDGSASAASDFDGPEPGDGAFQPPPGASDSPEVVAAKAAGHVRFTSGKYEGKSLTEVAELEEGYIAFVLGPKWRSAQMKDAARAYSRVYLPYLYEAATAQQEIHA